jgi:PAS domain S-box-containing protein
MSQTRHVRILLVEDNPGDANLVHHMLRSDPGRLRFEVTFATTLAEARKALAEKTFEAILLDLSLPDSQGLDTVAAMLEAAPKIPILALTGLDDSETGLKAVHMGAQDYLVKGHGDGDLLRRAILYAEDRKANQLTIEKLNSHNELILKSLGEGLTGCDAKGMVSFLNPKIAEMTGRNPAELLWHPPSKFLKASTSNGDPILDTIKDGKVRHIDDAHIETKDGRLIPVDYIVTPIHEGDAITGAVAAFRDVTDRQQAFEVLKDQLNFQQQVADCLPIPFFCIDEQGLLIACNQAFEELLGLNRARLLGRSVEEALPAWFADPCLDALEARQNEFKISVASGAEMGKRGHVRLSPLHAGSGLPGGQVGVFLEIGD